MRQQRRQSGDGDGVRVCAGVLENHGPSRGRETGRERERDSTAALALSNGSAALSRRDALLVSLSKWNFNLVERASLRAATLGVIG